MNPELSKLFLCKIHEMIRLNKMYFVPRTYPDGLSYIDHLARLGIESLDEAWEYILQLDERHYCDGPCKDISEKTGAEQLVVWMFKIQVNGEIAYIKIKDESERRGCVCISFHKDQPYRAF